MIARCVFDGIRSAFRRPGLVLLLWAWNLLLGLVVAMPAYNWWTTAFSFSPGADSMRDRFDTSVLADLTKYDQVSGFAMLSGVTIGAIVLAVIASAFVNGGILEVLATEGDPRSFMHRFFRGAGHFFGRYFRLLVVTLVSAIVVSAIVAAVVGAATSRLSDIDWEPAGFLVGIFNLLVLAVVWGWFLLAQDYARIRIANEDRRGVLGAWIRSLGFVTRRVFATFAIGILITIVSAILLGVWLVYDGNAQSATWSGILVLVLVQQAVLAARTGLRVAMVGAERHYYLRNLPPAPAVQAVPEAVRAEVDPTPALSSTEPPAPSSEPH